MGQTKITEKIEFKTDIIRMYNGDEQRIKLRQVPRRYYTYDYSAMNAYQAQYLRGMLRMRHSDVYYVPMWHSPLYLKENFIKNGKALYIDTDYLYNLLDCDYIMLFYKDELSLYPGANIVKQVHRYDSEKIALKKKIAQNLYKENTFIHGLKKCSIQPNAGLQYIYSNGTEVGISFEDINYPAKTQLPYVVEFEYQKDVPHYNPFNLPEEYEKKEVFLKSPQWLEDNSVSLSIDKGVQRMDNDTGYFVYDLINNHTYDSHTYELYLMGIKEINNYKKFFLRMCGMYKSFYMPTWVNDIQIDRDVTAGDNAIYTYYDELYKFYLNNTRKKRIVIFTKDFKSYIYKISAYTYEMLDDKVKYGKIILEEPIKDTITKENILMCSFFNCVRFNNDAMQFNYESTQAVGVTMNVKEVNDPDIGFKKW